MAITHLDLGTTANDGNGDSLRVGGQIINDNFDLIEVYTEITVGASGYDFTTISDALASITDASINNRYRILVYQGTYVETFTTKNYVDIIGEDKYKCIIDYVGVYADAVNLSTIFATSTSKIENLTIKCYDAKYPIHTDALSSGFLLEINNCVLQHVGFSGAGAGTPFGIGLYKSQHIKITNSELIGDGVAGNSGIAFHNIDSAAADNGYRGIHIENCNIKDVTYGIRATGLSSIFDQSNDAFIINNVISSITGEIFYDATTDLSWNIIARGNNIRRVYHPNNNYIVEQPGFTRKVKNIGPPIYKGNVVVLSINYAISGTTTSDKFGVTGVCLEDIATGNFGIIQISGYVDSLTVNGATPIVLNDTLSTYNSLGIAKKGTSNIFAIASSGYAVADSNGVIAAILMPLILS